MIFNVQEVKKILLTFFTAFLTLTALAGTPVPEGGFTCSGDTLLFHLNGDALPEILPAETAPVRDFSAEEERSFLRGRPGLGFSMGYHGNFYQGKMTRYLGAMHDFSMGADFINGGFRVHADMCFGGAGRLRKGGFEHQGYVWQEGENVSGAKFTLSAGYRAFELGRVAFYPYFGFGAGVVSQGTGVYDIDDEGDYYEISSDSSGLRYFGGLRIDIPFQREFSTDPSADHYDPSGFGEAFEYGIALRLFVARDNHSVPCPATSLNVGLLFYFSNYTLF